MSTAAHGHSRMRELRDNLATSQWFLPSVAVVAALVVGEVLVRVDRAQGIAVPFFPGDLEEAREVLILVAGSVLAVATLVFSVILLALQVAGQQYSPRLHSNFLRDRGNGVVLSIFLATFAYCLAVLRAIGTGPVPQLAMAALLVLVLASLGAFVYYIHHASTSLRVDAIMRTVEQLTIQAINRNHGQATTGPQWTADLPPIPDTAVPIPAQESGYITTMRPATLVPLAQQHDVIIRFARAVGDQAVAGAPLAWVWSRQPHVEVAQPDRFVGPINAAVRQGVERTLQQDSAYGVRQLVDIAVRAASEAVIDPGTAVDAIGHLAVVMAQLAARPLGNLVLTDQATVPRIAVPRRDFAAYLDLAVTQIRTYAWGDPFLYLALLQLLRDAGLATVAQDRHALIRHHVDEVVASAVRAIQGPGDEHRVIAAAEELKRDLELAARSRRQRSLAQDITGASAFAGPTPPGI